MAFTHLHVHTEYSLLDGYTRVSQLVETAKAQGHTAIAMTDHGNMAATIPFLNACKLNHIKPIIGCEVYMAAGSRFDKATRADFDRTHLILLAKDQAGLENLFALVSLAHIEGHYYKPRIDRESLTKYSKGLICLSGCIASELSQCLLNDDEDRADEVVEWHKNLFKDDYYIELQSHQQADFMKVLNGSIAMARKHAVKVVATNDVHYIKREDAAIQEVLSAIGREKREGDPRTLDDYYLKSSTEMQVLFQNIPQAISSTIEITNKIGVVGLPERVQIPLVPELRGKVTPAEENELAVQTIQSRCLTRLKDLYKDPLPQAYQDRLDYEVAIIRETGFASYLLLVADITRFAKESHIRYGPRGSAAGSLVCHGLGISEPDPIAHGLIFERFLNPARIDMPDVDLDFQDNRRAEIYTYLSNTYGPEHVAAVATYGTLGAKAAIKDVTRALEKEYATAELITRALGDNNLTDGLTTLKIQDILSQNPEFKDIYAKAMQLEGIARHASTHAAAIVISGAPLTKLAPLMRCPRDEEKIQVQYEGEIIQKAGLLKMDILGLDNLTVLDKAIRIIESKRDIKIDVWNLPWDDAQTYNMLCTGKVHGVFQLGTSSGKRLTKDIQPRSIDDLMALVALNRPGPIDFAGQFANVKHGKEPFVSPHALITDIVSSTNGIIIYQEQILQIARKVAGFSYGEADILRKAIGKKNEELLSQQKQKFIDGAIESSKITAAEANGIWLYFEPFARYGFNRAHACAYAYLAFQTAYIKAHYPLAFMAAVLEVASDNQDKVALGIAEATILGIDILPPSVQTSQSNFSIEGRGIRFGLSAIKNVGINASESIMAHAPYKDLGDFVFRSGLTKSAVEALIKSGATGFSSRNAELDILPDILKATSLIKRQHDIGQLSMFDAVEAFPMPNPYIPEAPLEIRLNWEREFCGTWVSANPLKNIAAKTKGVTLTCDVTQDSYVTMIGEIRKLKRLLAHKSGKPLMVGELADTAGTIKIVCFNKDYERTEPDWQEGYLVILKGRVGSYEDSDQLIVNDINVYQEPPPPDAVITFTDLDTPDSFLKAYDALINDPGNVRVLLTLNQKGLVYSSEIKSTENALKLAHPV